MLRGEYTNQSISSDQVDSLTELASSLASFHCLFCRIMSLTALPDLPPGAKPCPLCPGVGRSQSALCWSGTRRELYLLLCRIGSRTGMLKSVHVLPSCRVFSRKCKWRRSSPKYPESLGSEVRDSFALVCELKATFIPLSIQCRCMWGGVSLIPHRMVELLISLLNPRLFTLGKL